MRTTALREALEQLHGQLEELRDDHKQLQVGQHGLDCWSRVCGS